MKVGYVKQSFKCLISTQIKLLKQDNCLNVKIVSENNKDYFISEIKQLKADDEIVVVKLFVLANNIKELTEILEVLGSKKVKLKVLEYDISNNKPVELVKIVEVVNSFVKDVNKQKQLLGIIRAKVKGKQIGRPRKLNKVKLEKAIDLRQYYTNEKVAKMLKVSRSTLLRNIAEFRKVG